MPYLLLMCTRCMTDASAAQFPGLSVLQHVAFVSCTANAGLKKLCEMALCCGVNTVFLHQPNLYLIK